MTAIFGTKYVYYILQREGAMINYIKDYCELRNVLTMSEITGVLELRNYLHQTTQYCVLELIAIFLSIIIVENNYLL